jgi:PTH1 family peptidyl-tRNA hydrolase
VLFGFFGKGPKLSSKRGTRLIVGLGNPGRTYANNRHNVGFMCVGYFAREQHISLDKKKASARIGHGEVDGVSVVLARPQTYMNASGGAVASLLKRLKTSVEDLIVVYDDMDLPLGKMRIRKGGSSGGHKGIQSIISETGSPDFVRVRVGIGRPHRTTEGTDERKRDVVDHVLTEFTPDERQTIDRTIPKVSEALSYLLREGLAAAMNRYNANDAKPLDD